MKFQFVLTLFICLAMQVLEAAAISVTDYYSITTSEGLPSNTIGAIKKDSSGFIWLGTGAGLCRFDGCEIKTYPVLAGDDIWSIEELDTDTLLIGTVSGFKYFSRKTNEVSVLDIPSTIVKAIKKIDDRRFLAGTEAGLFLVDKHTPRQILLDSGLSPCNHITSIIREDKDVYWFSTADGLGRIDVRTMKPVIYRMKDALSNTNFFICLTRIGNQIYLGSFNKGVFRFDMSDKKFTKVDGFEHNLIMTIEAQGNQLFVGTNGQGLKIMSLTDGSIEIASHKEKIRNTISSNTITSFLYDNGIQWVGTQFGGVSYTPSTKARFFCYSKNDFYTADYKVRSFYMFPDGNKLIGTRAGLFHVSEKDGTVRKYSLENHSSKLRSNIILFINKVDDKILWTCPMIIKNLTGGTIDILSKGSTFWGLIVGQDIWRETGYGTIIFLAALAGVDQEMYEAARVDGAGRWRLMWHITLPAIKGTIIMMLILRVGGLLNTGYEQIFLMRNDLNMEYADVFDTYIYTRGIVNGQYSFSSAAGMFKSVVGMILVLGSNKISKMCGEAGIY